MLRFISQTFPHKNLFELISRQKQKGMKVTASVNAYNMALDDTALMEFDSNYKLNPPLRTKVDIEHYEKELQMEPLIALLRSPSAGYRIKKSGV